MLRTLIYLIFISFNFSQNELVVVKTAYLSKIQTIEQDILQNVVELYERKTGEKLPIRYVTSYDFSYLFSMLDSVSVNNLNYSLMLTAVSITPEREETYDFSVPYMPAKEVIFGLKKAWDNNPWDFNNKRIGYTTKSVQEVVAKEYQRMHPSITIKEYHSWEHMIIGLKAGEIDAGLMDNVSVWADDKLMVIEDVAADLQQGKGLGIMYPKGSTLKAKLDPIIKYYLKSQKFYSFCAKQYGMEVANYYKEHVLFERSLR
jgi:ABC-type amino acid transport substrate-binding protein